MARGPGHPPTDAQVHLDSDVPLPPGDFQGSQVTTALPGAEQRVGPCSGTSCWLRTSARLRGLPTLASAGCSVPIPTAPQAQCPCAANLGSRPSALGSLQLAFLRRVPSTSRTTVFETELPYLGPAP